jgi:hypothetical protein
MVRGLVWLADWQGLVRLGLLVRCFLIPSSTSLVILFHLFFLGLVVLS